MIAIKKTGVVYCGLATVSLMMSHAASAGNSVELSW